MFSSVIIIVIIIMFSYTYYVQNIMKRKNNHLPYEKKYVLIKAQELQR